MRAVVLVGGEGTRLRPLTFTVPKQALPIVEVPMIERVLTYLASHGITEVVLSLGYRHESFLSLFPDGHSCGVGLALAIEPQPLGTAGAVRFAARAAGVNEPCVVVNGDVLTDLDLAALIEFHRERGAEGTIALGPVDDPSRYGAVSTDADGRVLAFVEKPGGSTGAAMPSGDPVMVNAGTYVLEPSVLDRIPDGRAVSIEREVFPFMAEDATLFARGSDAYWADTGTPSQYLQVQLDLVSGRRPGPPVTGATLHANGVWTLGASVLAGEVEGPAFVGQAAFVEAGAHVSRAIVSSGARVHAGARVSDSVLLPGAVVRAGATLDHALVGDRAVIGENAEVRDLSIVGTGVEVPAGARLIGARVPETADGVRVGTGRSLAGGSGG